MEEPLNLRERRNMAHESHESHEPHEDVLFDLHMCGQDLYRQKKYEAALQCFTEVRAHQPHSKSKLTSLPFSQSTRMQSLLSLFMTTEPLPIQSLATFELP